MAIKCQFSFLPDRQCIKKYIYRSTVCAGDSFFYGILAAVAQWLRCWAFDQIVMSSTLNLNVVHVNIATYENADFFFYIYFALL